MTRTRITTARLQQLTNQLPARYTTPLPHLKRTRLLTGAHLDRLLSEPAVNPQTTARIRRRIMNRLRDLGLVDALQRRIGGIRAGSAGHIYTLTTAGHKYFALLNGQQPPGRIRHSHNPGSLFLAHTLTISGIYVDLIQTSRAKNFQVATFVTEPDSWWPQGNGVYLRPDAYTVLATPTHQDCWWLEIDAGTETLPRLREKLRAYTDHATHNHTGPNDALPRVLFTTPNTQRATAINHLITGASAGDRDFISVTVHDDAARLIVAELHQT